jgi:hypothetical protein
MHGALPSEIGWYLSDEDQVRELKQFISPFDINTILVVPNASKTRQKCVTGYQRLDTHIHP